MDFSYMDDYFDMDLSHRNFSHMDLGHMDYVSTWTELLRFCRGCDA